MITHPNVKVNIGLSVLRKRPDGFHDIETLFVPYFGIHDTLEIVPSETFSINIRKDDGLGWDPMSDLTVKAYELLRRDFGIPPVSINLTKTSPVGAGLGGGSSDAAFAIGMLDELFSLGLSEEKRALYASRLGSDCAFFVFNRPMLGSGRGEILEPYDLYGLDYGQEGGEKLPLKLDVVVPAGVAVSTAEAYRGIIPVVPEVRLKDALKRPVGEWKDIVVNDFEKTVFPLHPEIKALKDSMYRSGALYASMSGSGSSVYSIHTK